MNAPSPRRSRPPRDAWHSHCLFVGDPMRSGPCHKRSPLVTSSGFTLVEIAVTILILGLLFAIAAPSVQQLSGSYHLKAVGENLAGQLRLARERAIATGKNQHFHFSSFSGSDYYIYDHTTNTL